MKKKILLTLVVLVVMLFIFISVAKKTPTTISVEHTFNAPIDKVWQIWTNEDSMKKWWSPKDYTAPVIKSDFRIGGSFLLSMKSPDDKMFWNTGKYLEIVEHTKIVSSLSFSDENGQVVPAATYGIPGEWPDEVLVTVDFSEVDGKAHVKVQEQGIPMIMSMFAKMGWQQQFDKFDELIK